MCGKNRIVYYAVFSVFMLILSGCPEIQDLFQPAAHLWQVRLNMEECTILHPRDYTAGRYQLELTLTNTGNQDMEDMALGIITDYMLDFELSKTGISGLKPGESDTFTVTFPVRNQAILYTATILAGNKTAAARLELRYGVYDLIDDPLFTVTPDLLQLGENAFCTISAPDIAKTGELICSNGTLDGDVLVLPDSSGEILVGYLVSENPCRIKGKKITVYPAVQDAALSFTAAGSTELIRNNNGTAAPLNLAELREQAEGRTLRFRIANDGGGIVSSINSSSGEITFSGSTGDSGLVTIVAEIIQNVPEGVVTIYRGSTAFTAKVGIAPAPVLLEAGTVNASGDVETFRINLIFDQAVYAGNKDAKDGFTFAKTQSAALGIQQALIADNVIQITLNSTSPVLYGDTVTLSYNQSQGGIQNSGNTLLEDITVFTVTNNLEEQPAGPQILAAEIDGTLRADANKLVISYDMAPVLSNSNGFTIENISGGAIGFTAYKADAGAKTITLTMSRIPMWSELAANNLVLHYNAAQGSVRGENGGVGSGGSVPVALKNFSPLEYEPPAVVSAVIDGNAQTGVVIEWSKNLAAGAGFGGFS
ncbi:MAG: hypothetical protein FWF29_05535, partial [Treponema sp.]|nr:hypothetical protein [Treponema sp.]